MAIAATTQAPTWASSARRRTRGDSETGELAKLRGWYVGGASVAAPPHVK